MNNVPEDKATEAALTKPERAVREVLDILEIFVASVCAVILLFTFFARLTVVTGESMENTLIEGDYLVVSDLLYEPKQGDIIVIHDVTSSHSEPLVKRVIAVGGDVIDIDPVSWEVRVNGEVIDEPYAKFENPKTIVPAQSFPYTVPEGEVYVMGDNRFNSSDSRMASIGTIDERCIVGKALFRIFPFEKTGSIYDYE